MNGQDAERFVSEPMTPLAGTGDARAAARGEPGLPDRFAWRDAEYRVVAVLRQWKTAGDCRSGSAERYVRRHWFTIRTEPAQVMTVYCDRQARDRKRPKARWWVYTVGGGAEQ